MKNKSIYEFYQRLTKNKDCAVKHIIETTLNKTQSMFKYDGLPETIPAAELENILQRNGYCIVTEVNGELYALYGGLGGELNAYYKPTKCIVANPYLNISKEYTIENNADCVFFKNDYLCRGLMPIIGKYAVLLTDNGISLNAASVLSRLTMLISASDDRTKQSAEMFLDKILGGDFGIIGENAFLKGVTLQQINNSNTLSIVHLTELNQYYKANLLNEIGLNAQFNMKRERLSENEILLNNDEILPFAENMLNHRILAVNAINEKYGTNIKVDFASSWKTEHETNEKATETENTQSVTDIIEPATPIEPNEPTEQTEPNEPKENDRAAETTETVENTTDTENDSDTAKIVEIIREMRENEQNENDNETK